ncbi:hypothetical protein [Enhygromyxa salina]|uniref:Lipoprotein n=1 Tax=Enhygromyxa salina TaxID=215803 RepID=A0A2S9YVF6_9BACT|nr:hypothetical protein [Enhygromyxa salina]PRQ09032.1 hypothetical protein ENSA7_13030 [Enhygromyxa salina]
MKRITQGIMMLVAVSTLSLAACDKKDEAAGDKDKKETADADKPSLRLSNDTEECRNALKCCEAMVSAEKGSATPEDINLSCSGVGMADSDDLCKEFKKGFTMALEAGGKPVPDACK